MKPGRGRTLVWTDDRSEEGGIRAFQVFVPGSPIDDVIAEARRHLRELGLEEPTWTSAPSAMRPQSATELAGRIDHTLLRPQATSAEIAQAAELAVRLGCAALCVAPHHAPVAKAALRGTPVRLACVVAFPHGDDASATKAFAAAQAVTQGADEIDMVASIGALRAAEDRAVYGEIRFVRLATPGTTLKVILETAALTEAETARGALLAVAAGADLVKTSTGYGPGGATVETVALLRRTVGGAAGVKASGGIRTLKDALAMLDAGASRLGLSATERVIAEWEAKR